MEQPDYPAPASVTMDECSAAESMSEEVLSPPPALLAAVDELNDRLRDQQKASDAYLKKVYR